MTSSLSWLLFLGSEDPEELLDPSWSQITDAFFSLDGQCVRRDLLILTCPSYGSLSFGGGNSQRFLVSFEPVPAWVAPHTAARLTSTRFPTRYLQAVDLYQTASDLPLCLQPPVSSPAYAVLSWPLLSQLARSFFEKGSLHGYWEIETEPAPAFLPVPPAPPADSPHASSPSLLVLGPSSSQSFPSPDWSDLETALFCLDGHSLTHAFFSHPDRGTLAVLGGLQQHYALFFFPHGQPGPGLLLQAMDPSLAGPDVELCIQVYVEFPSRIAVRRPLAWHILQHFYQTLTIPRDVHWLSF
ncbi:hypothetical protein [Thermogemmatispora onikobensis]|uniref:hypothetical protein n=1 Tax=Thermogemmatispora onikobensis TaxID=732234 RepID=UPI0008532B3F|nr:hypothetical protein [Thermogemmatispora onikobensis]